MECPKCGELYYTTDYINKPTEEEIYKRETELRDIHLEYHRVKDLGDFKVIKEKGRGEL